MSTESRPIFFTRSKKNPGAIMANRGASLIDKHWIEAVEKDCQPLGSMYDGRAALEMILAVYESWRLQRAVELPLKNRQHPLTMNQGS
jgi:hypothetical protein